MKRDQQFESVKSTDEFDVVIIGGGATGLGCAVDAASRGLKTLLLEKFDFAKGTSSRATKLVHGGVRYLAQGNLRLVREALLERGRLLNNAPHLCLTLPFVVPAYRRWDKFYYGIGLKVYEFLSFRWSLGKTKWLSPVETLKRLPQLNPDRLRGGIQYYDGQFDDSRLAINLAQTAVEHGATVLNYCEVTGFEKRDDKIVGLHATDTLTKACHRIAAKVIINATGVFGDHVLQLADPQSAQTISPSQGVHLVVDRRFFTGTTALMVPKTDDGRVLFAIPWHNRLLLGTTDTPVDQVDFEPRAQPEEIEFIIQHFNRFSTNNITVADVESVFAGLRPLANASHDKRTSVMPRDHVIKVLPSGLVHVTGGKWTTYRSMAEHAIDAAVAAANLDDTMGCQTRELKIHGYPTAKTESESESDSDRDQHSHLAVYGSDANRLIELIRNDETLGHKIHPQHPYCWAEIDWAIDHEKACTVEDVLARRIRLLFLDANAALTSAPAVAQRMAYKLGHDEQWIKDQIDEFTNLARGYLLN